MQVSWIDADEVGALLGRLRDAPPPQASIELTNAAPALLVAEIEPVVHAEVPEPPAAVPQAPAESSSDSHRDLDLFRARLQAIRERAMNAGLLPGEAAEPRPAEPDSPPVTEEEVDMAEEHPEDETPPASDEAPSWTPYRPSGNSVNERLDGFASWARPLMNGSHLFVIDDQGDLLWGQSLHQELVVTTVMAWVAFSRMSGVLAFERVPLLHQRMATGDHLTALPCPTRLGLLHIAITGDHALADEHLPELRQALIAAMEAS
jgi:hypothetical protein